MGETRPRERGIIFTSANVRAILAGRKTQTRRVLPDDLQAAFDRAGEAILRRAPRQRGIGWDDVKMLWVREGFAALGPSVIYREGHEKERGRGPRVDAPWRSPLFMPRKLSRLTLTVADVRVERLHWISEADAVAEGAMSHIPCKSSLAGTTIQSDSWYFDEGDDGRLYEGISAREAYEILWGKIHGWKSWDANPWVAAITFAPETSP